MSGTSTDFEPLTDAQLRRSILVATLLTFLLPPFIGGTLMGLVGFYPMPEFYLVFFDYSLPYVAVVVGVALALVPRWYRYVVGLTQMRNRAAREARAKRAFARLPWWLLVAVTLYSMGGVFSADLSLEHMGIRSYTVREHLYNQFGLIPVVLITVFPIFFFFVDRLGRYLGPRGITVTAIPLWMKLLMLGIVTPLLIDSLLIGYYYNRTGYFQWETLVLWLSLVGLAMGGTWIAWRSLQQGIAPLQAFIDANSGSLVERARASLTSLSLDEFGVLTSRYSELLTKQQELAGDLQNARSLANAMVDNAGVLVVLLDRQGRFVRFNRACEVLSGYSFAEVEGKCPWDTVVPPEIADTVRREAFEALTNNPQALAGSYANEWVSKDGKRSLLSWSNTVLVDAAGKMEFVVSVGMDITESRRAEERLRRSEQELKALNESLEIRVAERAAEVQLHSHRNELILRTTLDGFFAADTQGRIRVANPAFCAMLGYAEAELLQMSLPAIEAKELPEDVAAHIEKVLNLGHDRFDSLHRRSDGTIFPVELSVTLVDVGGEKLFYAFARDITLRHESEAALVRARDEAALSGAMLRSVLDAAPSRIFWKDRDSRYLGGNQSFVDDAGRTSSQELVGLSDYDMAWKASADLYRADDALVMTTGVPKLNFEEPMDLPDGSRIWLSTSKVPLLDENGKVRGVLGVYEAITARKEMENSLKETALRLNAAQQVARVGDYTLDLRSGVLTWSDAIFDLVGLAPGSVVPSNDLFLSLIHPDDLPAVREGMDAALARVYAPDPDGRVRLPDFAYRVVRADGTILWLHSKAIGELDADGRVVRLQGTVQDVTASKQAEAELMATKEEAERANHAKSEFLSRMSHELRTPMNAILGFSQVLEAEGLPPEQEDYVQEIHRAGDHLLELINELLDLSRIETGKLAAVVQAVDLQMVLTQSVQIVQSMMAARNVSLLNECLAPLQVLADPTRLRQVLVNLLSNATKYNREGGRVTLTCRSVGEAMLRVSVTDTGQGIAPEKLNQLFKPFERLGAEFTAVEGSGIGLALSKQLAELMGANLGVESQPGRGTTFWIDLPLADAEQGADTKVGAGDTAPDESAATTRASTVLYIEDNPANLRVVEAMFRHFPHLKLLSGTNGEYGLELARRYTPDVILLDINLPDMDGYEVLKRLQANPTTRDIPVIALSADAMPLDIETGLKAGFREYLTKPVKVQELVATLDGALAAGPG